MNGCQTVSSGLEFRLVSLQLHQRVQLPMTSGHEKHVSDWVIFMPFFLSWLSRAWFSVGRVVSHQRLLRCPIYPSLHLYIFHHHHLYDTQKSECKNQHRYKASDSKSSAATEVTYRRTVRFGFAAPRHGNEFLIFSTRFGVIFFRSLLGFVHDSQASWQDFLPLISSLVPFQLILINASFVESNRQVIIFPWPIDAATTGDWVHPLKFAQDIRVELLPESSPNAVKYMKVGNTVCLILYSHDFPLKWLVWICWRKCEKLSLNKITEPQNEPFDEHCTTAKNV